MAVGPRPFWKDWQEQDEKRVLEHVSNEMWRLGLHPKIGEELHLADTETVASQGYKTREVGGGSLNKVCCIAERKQPT